MRTASLVYVALFWAALLGVLLPPPATAEDIPALDFAFGQPAIAVGSYGTWQPPNSVCPIAVDEARIYTGGTEITLLDRDGDWLDFWPFDSSVSWPDYEPGGSVTTSLAYDLAVSPSGPVYVLDEAYSTVSMYDADGVYLGGWGGEGEMPWQFYHPIALCASPDSSVFVLDSGPGRIQHFTGDGAFLNLWNTPTAVGTAYCVGVDIAAAPDGGVWLLNKTLRIGGDVIYVEEIRLHHYTSNGVETATWALPVDDAFAINADPAGNIWVLIRAGGERQLQRYTPAGTLLTELPISEFHVENFAISSDSKLFVLVITFFYVYRADYAAYRIEVMDLDGNPLLTVGDLDDMTARGTLFLPYPWVVDGSGEAYTKVSLWERPYVVHHSANGDLLEVILTDDWPVYDPRTDTVTLEDQYRFIGTDGNSYYAFAEWSSTAQPRSRWILGVNKRSPGGELLDSYQVLGPMTDTHTENFGQAMALGPDGALYFALCAADPSWWDGGLPIPNLLWVVSINQTGGVLTSWTAEDQDELTYLLSLAVDHGGSLYLGGDRVVKYSPSGDRVGLIGGWGGSGDQRDAPGSLVQHASGLHVDTTGHLRVLDYDANRILVFAYTPGPFPDVPYYHWAKDWVRAVASAGIAIGYDDFLYHPDWLVTRSQMAVYVARALAGGDAQVPVGPDQLSFIDVPQGYWAYDYIEYLKALDIVTGYSSGDYQPEGTVTRGQMAVFLARALAGSEANIPAPPSTATFPDVTSDNSWAWCYSHVEYLAARGVVRGYPDGFYRPGYVCSRDQMAVYITRAFELPV